MDFDFSGRSVIVAGAARGIGHAISRAFASWHADVTMVDIDQNAPAKAADGIGEAEAADVCQVADIERVVGGVVERTGRVDVLVNNAGLFCDAVVWKQADDDWALVLDTHAAGTFRFTCAVVPHMRSAHGGRIVNVTSYSGLRGNPGQVSYSTAKAGIIDFTKTTAKELARFGITVNAISPIAETRMVATIPDARRAELTASIPLGHFAAPDQIAPAVGFLASDEARYVTGIVLPVDGGLSI